MRRFSRSWQPHPLATALLGVAVFAILQVGVSRMIGRSAEPTEPILVPPTRQPTLLPPPASPEVPGAVERVTPLTIDVSIRTTSPNGQAHRVRQTIARAADRAHVKIPSESEWYFERNPLDGRRVSGVRIEHQSRTLVIYSDAELQTELGIAGWASVVTLGVDPSKANMRDDPRQVRIVDGVRFTKYSGVEAGASYSEVWWNGEHALPALAISRTSRGDRRIVVERLRMGIDPDLLRHPARRFPEYHQVDVADWRERP